MSTAALQIDQLIDHRYRVLAKLGEGGMGSVYQVRDLLHPDRPLVLKVLQLRGTHQPYIAQQISREFEALSLLEHPAIPKVYDLKLPSADGLPVYFTADDIAGVEFLSAPAHQSFAVLLGLAMGIAQTMAYFAGQGVLHGDIKPSNILVRENGDVLEPVIVDFGLACRLGENRPLIAGTPVFSAPEVLRGGTIDARSDLYSLGVTLYLAFTGQLPRAGRTRAELLDSMESSAIVRPRQLRSAIPIELENILLRLLEVRPEHRYARADDVLEDLTRITPVNAGKALGAAMGTVFVGRQAQWDALLELDGGHRTPALVVGEAGGGKTAFLQRFKNHVLVQGGRIIEIPGSALMHLPETIAALELQLQPLRGFNAVEQIVKNLKGDTPPRQWVVMIDDLHLASPAVMRFLTQLAAQLRDSAPPLAALWIASVTPESLHSPHLKRRLQRARVTQIVLPPLEASAIAAYLQRRRPDLTVSSDLLTRIAQLSRGNPAAIAELAQTCNDSQSLHVPARFRKNLTTDWSGLGDVERTVLKWLAALAMPVCQSAIHTFFGDSGPAALERLEHRPWVVRKFQRNEAWFEIAAPHLQHFIEGTQNAEERRVLHRSIAQTFSMPQIDLALQWVKGGCTRENWALIEAAARTAQNDHDNERAAVLVGALHACAPTVETALWFANILRQECEYAEALQVLTAAATDSVELHHEAAEINLAMLRPAQAKAHLSAAAQLLKRKPQPSAELYHDILRGRALNRMGEFDESVAVAQARLKITADSQVLCHLGTALALQGKLDLAQAAFEQAVSGHPALAFNGLGVVAFHRGQLTQAQEFYEKAVAEARGNQDERLLLPFLMNLATAYQQNRRGEEALHTYHQALHLAEHLELGTEEFRVLRNLAVFYLQAFHLEKAAEMLERAEFISETESVSPDEEISLLQLQAQLAHAQGNRPQAISLIDKTIAVSRAAAYKRGLAEALLKRINLAYDAKDLAAASAVFSEARALVGELGMPDLNRIVEESTLEVAVLSGSQDSVDVGDLKTLPWRNILLRATLLDAQGNKEAASRAYRTALDKAEAYGRTLPERLRTYWYTSPPVMELRARLAQTVKVLPAASEDDRDDQTKIIDD